MSEYSVEQAKYCVSVVKVVLQCNVRMNESYGYRVMGRV